MARIVQPSAVEKLMEGLDHYWLVFTDVVGNFKMIAITGREIAKIIKSGQGFDGSSIRGFVRLEESDLWLTVRFKSFRRMPASLSDNGKPFGIFFCDVQNINGTPFAGDPRQCLKRALRRAKRSGGWEFLVGPEIEYFIVLPESKNGGLDGHGYFDMPNGEIGATVTQEVVDILNAIDIHVECWHHEVAPSQFEIDLKYQDALTMADQVMLVKWILKRVAQKHGVAAILMPKPIESENGSGMHTHASLGVNGKNVFHNGRCRFNLSRTGKAFAAGLLHYVREFTIVTNMRVNSYKRLVMGYEAPVYVSGGMFNRSSLLRFPLANDSQATRVELRSPDPSCNPYLAFAVMLHAGLEGIKRNLPLRPIVEENIFHMTPRERRQRLIESLPGSLEEAIRLSEQSRFLQHALGSHIFTAFMQNERSEYDAYRIKVTPWEIEHA